MIKRIIIHVALMISYILCAIFISDYFPGYEDMIFRLCSASCILSFISGIYSVNHVVDDYPGFYIGVVEAWGLITVLVALTMGISSVLFIVLLAYLLFFPSETITYFIIQGYEVRRTGGR